MIRPRMRHKPYPWYDTYMAALFETEGETLERRILAAESELRERERHLFSAPDCAKEHNAVVAALRALAALRTCNGLPLGS